jgi:hypothetical protein
MSTGIDGEETACFAPTRACVERSGGRGRFKPMRRDYGVILGGVVIVVGTFVLGGIVYTYTHRPALIDAASHLFDRRQLPADL